MDNLQKEKEEAWIKIFNNLVLETDDYEGTLDEGNPTTLLKGNPESLKAFIDAAIATEREVCEEKLGDASIQIHATVKNAVKSERERWVKWAQTQEIVHTDLAEQIVGNKDWHLGQVEMARRLLTELKS